MSLASAICPSCRFENPRSWRACARCGEVLTPASQADVTTGTHERTLVDDTPDFAVDSGDAAKEISPEAADEAAEKTQPSDEPPLIGQVEAARAIRTAVERAVSAKAPTLVVLEGGPGSGKTRLLTYASEIAARLLPSVRVMYASCRKGGGDGPYAPFSRLLLDRFGVTPSSSPSVVRGQMAKTISETLRTRDAIVVAETTHLLGHVAGVPFPDSPFLAPLRDKPAELRRRACRAVRRLLSGEAQTQPVLVLLDDCQLMEEDGWAILQALCEAEGPLSIIISGAPPVASHAEQLKPTGGVAVGPIAPLELDDVAAMLHVVLPSLKQTPEALVAAIAHRSEGNPGAIRELTLGLLDNGVFLETSAGLEVDLSRLEAGDLPVTLEDAIQSRLARLDEFERATLERAAVIGEVFWDGAILAQMRSEREPPGDVAQPLSIWRDDEDLDALTAALGRLTDKGFIDHAGTSELPGAQDYRFQLAGARNQLYEQLDSAVKIRRHTAVARWLAVTAELRREGIAALIAPHLERAGMHNRAGRAYLEAAAYERRRLRTHAALSHVERALPLINANDVVRKIDAHHQYGSLLTTLGRYEEALKAFAGMLRLAWSIGARGKGGAALNRIARVYRQRGEHERALAQLERALTMFRRAGDIRGVAASLDDLAQVHHLRAENDLATQAAEEALGLRRAHADQRGEAVSLTTLGSIALSRGNLDHAESYFSKGLEIRKAIGDQEGTMQSHNLLGVVAFERGDAETAISSWKAALKRANEMADRRSECFLLNNLGEALVAAGDLKEGRQRLEEARALAGELGDKRAIADVERNRGLLAMQSDDENALDMLKTALRLAEEYGGKEAVAQAHRALGKLHARTLFDASGVSQRRAQESFLTSIDLFREAGSEKGAARSLAELGYYLVERGELESARERLHEARAIMRKMGLAELAKVESTLAALG